MIRDIIRAIAQQLRPIQTQVNNLVARAVVEIVKDEFKLQNVQMTVLSGEVREDVERFQNYGFTSVPLAGAEGVAVFPQGQRGHGLLIAVDDRRYRLSGLEDGEVGMYDHLGSKVVLKANGDIEMTPASGVTKIVGDVEVSGTLTATTDVLGGGISLKNHTHGYIDSVGSAATPTPSETDAPS